MKTRTLLLSMLVVPGLVLAGGPAQATQEPLPTSRQESHVESHELGHSPSERSNSESLFYVNRNAQADGDHEVHRAGCRYTPLEKNRIHLGRHPDCRSAVRAAKRHYRTADGCYHCARPCDTG